MAVSGPSGSSGTSNAAALAAQRAAEEARRRAEEAKKRAEAAQKRAKQAQEQAAKARQQQQAAQKKLEAAQKSLQKTKNELKATGADKPTAQERSKLEKQQAKQQNKLNAANDKNTELQNKARDQQKQVDDAQKELDAADQKLQAAQENVVKTATDAEKQMRSANEIARAEGKPAPFARNELRNTAVTTKEAVNAVDGASPQKRGEIQRQLAGELGQKGQEKVQDAISNQQQFEKLQRDPKMARTMEDMDIRSGEDLQGFGQRLAKEANGKNGGLDKLDLKDFPDRASLEKLIGASGATLSGADKKTVTDPFFTDMVSRGQDPQKIAKMNPSERAITLYQTELAGTVKKPLSQWTPEDAAKFTGALADQMEKYKNNPDMQDALMTASGNRLNRTAQLIGDSAQKSTSDDPNVEAMSRNIARIGNSARIESGARLAYMVASKINDDSELGGVDDGMGQVDTKFRDLVGAALSKQGKGDAADEMVQTSAGGFSIGDVTGWIGDRFSDAAGAVAGAFSDAANAVKDTAMDGFNFLKDQVVGQFGDAIRNAVTDLMDVDGAINRLKSPGDSSAVKVGLEGDLFGLDASVGASVKFTKTDSGYDMELTGEGSLGLAEKLGISGLGDAEGSVSASASATFKFSFDNKADATNAAETVAGVAVGAGLSGTPLAPAGAAMIASAGDELKDIADNYESTKFTVGANVGLKGEAANEIGVEANAQADVSVEIDKTGKTNLIVGTEAELSGEFGAAGKIPLPGGGSISPAQLKAQGSLGVETTIPIDPGNLGNIIKDPGGAIANIGKNAWNNASSTLTANIELSGGLNVAGKGKDPKNTLSNMDGVQFNFEATAKTKDLAGAMAKITAMDFPGAMQQLGNKVDIKGEVRAFNDVDAGIGSADNLVDGDAGTTTDGEGVNLGPIGNVQVTAAYASRQSRILSDFDGNASQLFDRYGNVLRGFSPIA